MTLGRPSFWEWFFGITIGLSLFYVGGGISACLLLSSICDWSGR